MVSPPCLKWMKYVYLHSQSCLPPAVMWRVTLRMPVISLCCHLPLQTQQTQPARRGPNTCKVEQATATSDNMPSEYVVQKSTTNTPGEIDNRGSDILLRQFHVDRQTFSLSSLNKAILYYNSWCYTSRSKGLQKSTVLV